MYRRNTLQRDLVLDAVKTLKNHPTAEEVYTYIVSRYPQVGKGTVYRNLNILTEDGLLRRVDVPGGPDRFDHTLEDHYHIVCRMCGKISDVDMDYLGDLRLKIRNTHGVEVLGYDIMFKGICQECRKIVSKN